MGRPLALRGDPGRIGELRSLLEATANPNGTSQAVSPTGTEPGVAGWAMQ